MSAAAPLVAAIELGGTKSVALIARGRSVIAMETLPTGAPEETLTALSDQIAHWQGDHRLAALGIASFGPLSLDPRAADYGRIAQTPKPGWSDTDIYGHFARRFTVPIGFDTDVAGAALAEGRWGAARGCGVHVYLTIGTGIGGGVVVHGRPVHGLVHPEIGHVRIRRAPGDGFAGICPFHGDCLEGLASGPAIAARAGAPGVSLPGDHPVWPMVAGDLAELMAMLVLLLSPERILIGGGVGSGRPGLLPMVHCATLDRLAGYVAGLDPVLIERLISAPALGDLAGPLGAVALAEAALAA